MDDLISRQAFIEGQCNSCDGWCNDIYCDCLNCKSDHRCDFIKDLADEPAVDAVEVVRCGAPCRWLYDEPDDYCCMNHKGLVKITPDSFCSYGERREENEIDRC